MWSAGPVTQSTQGTPGLGSLPVAQEDQGSSLLLYSLMSCLTIFFLEKKKGREKEKRKKERKKEK